MMKEMMKKIVTVLLVTHEQARTGCARGSRALRTALALALTFGFIGAAQAACLFDGPLGDRPLPLDAALSNGTHRIVWDMNAQGPSNKTDCVVFVVSAEWKSERGARSQDYSSENNS